MITEMNYIDHHEDLPLRMYIRIKYDCRLIVCGEDGMVINTEKGQYEGANVNKTGIEQ